MLADLTKKPARPLIFGEVLFDRFPDREVLGGAPFNVAWHLQGFGCHPLMITRIGKDPAGDRVREAMTGWDLDPSLLQFDSSHPTGAVNIVMTGTDHHFDILPDQAYDHIDAGEALERLEPVSPTLIYHGSLALRTIEARKALDALLRARPGPVFVDINLRPPWWRQDDLPPLLDRARWVKVNEEELDILADCFACAGGTREEVAGKFLRRFALDLLIVTRGEHGAIAVGAGSDTVHRVKPGEKIQVVDTVGAGDAFSAVMILGLLRNWPLPVMLARAQEFAGLICARRGATVTDAAMYRKLLRQWGNDGA